MGKRRMRGIGKEREAREVEGERQDSGADTQDRTKSYGAM